MLQIVLIFAVMIPLIVLATVLLVVGFARGLRAGVIGRDDAWRTPAVKPWSVAGFVVYGIDAVLVAFLLTLPKS
jgi:hypothetical protein